MWANYYYQPAEPWAELLGHSFQNDNMEITWKDMTVFQFLRYLQ